jgi:hypothetical protein
MQVGAEERRQRTRDELGAALRFRLVAQTAEERLRGLPEGRTRFGAAVGGRPHEQIPGCLVPALEPAVWARRHDGDRRRVEERAQTLLPIVQIQDVAPPLRQVATHQHRGRGAVELRREGRSLDPDGGAAPPEEAPLGGRVRLARGERREDAAGDALALVLGRELERFLSDDLFQRVSEDGAGGRVRVHDEPGLDDENEIGRPLDDPIEVVAGLGAPRSARRPRDFPTGESSCSLAASSR